MAALQEYKCPCCGGAVSFHAGLQKLKCPYCDAEFEMEALAASAEGSEDDTSDEMQWQTDSEAWNDAELGSMRTYLCRSCGGEIAAEETTAAASCPYCGNPVVMTGNLKGALKPDLIIPFQLDKEAAREAFAKHLQGKRLLPAVFRDQKRLEEIKGVYVPFWLFDADAEAHLRYKATKERTWEEGGFEYKEIKYYTVVRRGTLAFDAVPVNGSGKLSEELMESIEPFDVTKGVDFQTAYLAGYLADKYDLSSDERAERANARIKTGTEQRFSETVQGYDSVEPQSSAVRLHSGRARYALLPVWLMSTSWNGQTYTFAMNGQTGKFVGDLPLDKAAKTKWLLGITAACTAVITAVSYLIWLL